MKAKGNRIRYLRQAVRLVWASAPGWTSLQMLVLVVQGVLPVGALILTRQVVDAVGQFLVQGGGAREAQGLLMLRPWGAGVTLVGWLCRA